MENRHVSKCIFFVTLAVKKRSESQFCVQMYHMLWVIKRKALAIQFDLQLLKTASLTSIQSCVLIFSSVRFVFSQEGHLIHHWNDILHHEVLFSVHCCLCQESLASIKILAAYWQIYRCTLSGFSTVKHLNMSGSPTRRGKKKHWFHRLTLQTRRQAKNVDQWKWKINLNANSPTLFMHINVCICKS